MTLPRPQQYSPLSLFLLFSLAAHVIGLGIFIMLSPKFIEEKRTEISIQIGGMKANPASAPVKSTPIQQPKSVAPKVVTPPAPTPVQQAKATTPKAQPAATPIQAAKPTTQALPTPVQQPKPIAPKAVQAPPVKAAPVSPPVKPMPIATLKVLEPEPTPVTPKVVTPPAPVQQAKPVAPSTPVVDKTKEMSDKLDDALNKKTQTKSTVDALADAKWSGTPRKTLSFPNLTAKIPQQYKSRGYGFSITAKISFSPQGWVSSVELLRSSGDPRIDGIFRTELRKIRIEPSKKTTYDTITKTFTISVK